MSLSRVRAPQINPDVVTLGGSVNYSGVTTDERLIDLWLDGRSPHTCRAYRGDIKMFMTHVGRPLQAVTLADLQEFGATLTGAPSTRARRLSSVKSLLAFGHRVGFLRFDVGRPLRLPRTKDGLANRIVSEEAVHRMMAATTKPRDNVLLRLSYAAGLRVSEVCSLTWDDLVERHDGGQVTIFGKGGKTRIVLLTMATWEAVCSIRDEATSTDPVFRSRRGGHLHPSSVHRIVRKAAKKAGLEQPVSPHWLRHAHASHALDRGAAISLVSATLGHSSVATTGRYLHARPGDSSARYLGV